MGDVLISRQTEPPTMASTRLGVAPADELTAKISEKVIPVRLSAIGDAPLQGDLWVQGLDRMYVGKYDTTAIIMERDESLAQPDDRGVTLSFIKRGSIIGVQGGNTYTVRPGQGLVLSMATPSDVIIPEGGEWWGIRAQFDELMARVNCRAVEGKPMVSTDSGVLQLMWGYLEHIQALCIAGDHDTLGLGQSHLLDLVALLVEKSAQDPAHSKELSAVVEARFLQIRNVLAATLGDAELTLGEIARRCRLSERTVQQVLRSGGTTFSELLCSMRMEKARKLLQEQPAAKILNVAMDVGFTDQSAFSRAFRRWFGIAPADVRDVSVAKRKHNAR